MKTQRSELHFIVYSLGRPWKSAQDLVKEYMVIFRACADWEGMQRDLEKLGSLRDNSYDFVISQWDGKGTTPRWLWHDFGAQNIIYTSLATIKG